MKNPNTKAARILIILMIVVGSSAAQAQTHFSSPESEERYYSAVRDQQRYEAERAYWQAYGDSLAHDDRRIFAPIRRGADTAFRAGTYALPRYGGVVRRGYNHGMRRLRRESR